MENVVASFLVKLGAPVSAQQCAHLIRTHSDFPALVSISDTLDRLGIDHYVGKVDRNDLTALSYPYLLHTQLSGGEILCIDSEADLTTNEDALAHWSGVVIQVDPVPSLAITERIAAYHDALLRKGLLALLAVAGLLLSARVVWQLCTQSASALATALTLAYLASAVGGIVIGYFLVTKDLGIKYASVESFCAVEEDSRFDCNDILKSKGAQVFGSVKLSELVLAYFAFQVVALVITTLSDASPAALQWLQLGLALSTIPVMAYSLFYQRFVAQKWCKLCLLVNAVLLMQLGTEITKYLVAAPAFSRALALPWAGYAVLLVVVFAVVFLAKIFGKLALQQFKSEYQALRIKNSAPVFTHLLKQAKAVSMAPFAEELTIGDPNASLQIVAVLNLHCNPCKEHFLQLADIVSVYPERISVRFRFLLSGRDIGRNPTSVHYLLWYWLEHIRHRPDESAQTIALLRDWFGVMRLEKFQKIRPVASPIPHPLSEALARTHHQWIRQHNITRTPTIVVAGHVLPSNYNLEDILAMSQELIHHYQHQSMLAS
jgi:hypothetical protein